MVVISTGGCQNTSEQEDNGMKGKGRLVFSYAVVHIFFIDLEEKGATKRDTTTFKIVMIPLKDQNTFSDVVIPPAFLEAGDWFYPLILSKSPVYRTAENYYVFPDLSSTSPGAFVGIVFPTNMTADERDLFENILLTLAGLDEFPTGTADKFGNSGSLITSIDAVYALTDIAEPLQAEFFTKFQSSGEEDGGGIMSVSRITENGNADEPTQSLHFMDYGTGIEKSHKNSNFETANEYTGKAVEISGHAVSRLIEATSKLAVFSAHYLRSAASSVMGAIHDQTRRGTSAIGNGILSTTDGAMQAMKFVYAALHNAGRSLANSITHKQVLDHPTANPPPLIQGF